VVIGAGLHLLIQVPGLVRERMRYHFSFDWRDPSAREVGRLMGPRVVGLAAAQVNFLVTIYFGSKVGSSTISNLNYAWLLAGLPLALFGMALSTAVFPRLADHAADEDMASLTETISRVLRVIMFLTIPAALGLALLRSPATVVLLQRGEFTPGDAAITAAALGFYCLGIVPQAGIEIHSRGFYALGEVRRGALLWKEYEYRGLAFAVSVSSWLEWALLYVLYLRRTGASAATDLAAIARFALCGSVMALFLALAFLPFSDATRTQQAVIAVAGGIAGAAVYAGMAHWLGIEELREAASRLGGRLGRSSIREPEAPI
jgi:putative peptidoglycan lipid II flippase